MIFGLCILDGTCFSWLDFMVSSSDDCALNGLIDYVLLICLCSLVSVVLCWLELENYTRWIWAFCLCLGMYCLNSRRFKGLWFSLWQRLLSHPLAFGPILVACFVALANTELHFFNLFYRNPIVSRFIQETPLVLGIHDHGISFSFLCCFGLCFYLLQGDQTSHLKGGGLFGRIQ